MLQGVGVREEWGEGGSGGQEGEGHKPSSQDLKHSVK